MRIVGIKPFGLFCNHFFHYPLFKHPESTTAVQLNSILGYSWGYTNYADISNQHKKYYQLIKRMPVK